MKKCIPSQQELCYFVIFSVSDSIINAYGSNFPEIGRQHESIRLWNRQRLDSYSRLLDLLQMIQAPLLNKLIIIRKKWQIQNGNRTNKNRHQDSAEVNEDDISSKIKQEGSQEEEEQSAGDGQESNSDEEDNNAADGSEIEKKNNIPLNFKATTGLPFP